MTLPADWTELPSMATVNHWQIFRAGARRTPQSSAAAGQEWRRWKSVQSDEEMSLKSVSTVTEHEWVVMPIGKVGTHGED